MYDNICKYLAENFRDDLATWLLGSPIKLTELSPTELSNEPIRADSLILIATEYLTEGRPSIILSK
jgi:predicted transposase YdaD